jgi:peroxiredoxin Q/BCP
MAGPWVNEAACESGAIQHGHPAMKLRPLLVLMSLFSLLFGSARADTLKVGDAAPAVTANTDSGQPINLGDVYKKNKYTVVYFYPKADTPGCTKQGCSLRDANTELAKKGVAIVGVSTDTVEEQKAFKEKFHFPFTLIADTDKKVVKAFGQPGTGRAAREAYLIKDGKIVYKDEKVTEQQGENILAYLATQKS